MDILTSLHGRRIGLDRFGHIVLGTASGNYRVADPTLVRLYDDFLGDVLADQWNFQEGTDSGTSDAGISAAVDGTVAITTGDTATATMAANGAQLDSALNWKANQGALTWEARVQLDAITNVAVFIGLTDQVAALEMPILSAGSANTITTNATDAVGVMFDTAMSTDNWHLVGVAADTDATRQDSGNAPVANTYETWRVELTDQGTARFFRNGAQIGTDMTGAVTKTVALTPVLAIFSRTSASRVLTVDYVLTEANRV